MNQLGKKTSVRTAAGGVYWWYYLQEAKPPSGLKFRSNAPITGA